MQTKQALLEWKKPFLNRVAERSDRLELEQHFEQLVELLSAMEYKQASEYLELWNSGKTDSERFYFSKKIVEILQKRLPK